MFAIIADTYKLLFDNAVPVIFLVAFAGLGVVVIRRWIITARNPESPYRDGRQRKFAIAASVLGLS